MAFPYPVIVADLHITHDWLLNGARFRHVPYIATLLLSILHVDVLYNMLYVIIVAKS